MKKKRNTPYKPAVKTRIADILITLLCVSGLLFTGSLFYRDLIRMLDKEAAIPIGSLVRKNNAVLRQHLDGLLWTRLAPESPVYSGDAIRTGWLSDAVITFANRDSAMLSENSAVRIAMDANSRTRIELSAGVISARSKKAELLVSYEAQTAIISGGGAVQAVDDGNGVILSVTEGRVILLSGHTTRLVSAGTAVCVGGTTVSAESTAALPKNPSVVVLSPPPIHEVLSAKFPVPAFFSWTTAHFSLEHYTRLDIALDRQFSRIVRAIASPFSSVSVDLAEGTYWWRIYPAKDDSGSAPISLDAVNGSTGMLRVRREPQ
ncbi:MAG: FecR family protein [Treponema sp.]|jgi:hypothetical protein|nr:FecR family protein [Treponema sp.]